MAVVVAAGAAVAAVVAAGAAVAVVVAAEADLVSNQQPNYRFGVEAMLATALVCRRVFLFFIGGLLAKLRFGGCRGGCSKQLRFVYVDVDPHLTVLALL